METFSALLAICAGNSPFPGEFPTQRPVTRSFDVFFHLRPNKRLSKQWWGWWFVTQSCPLWRHRNELLFHAFSSIRGQQCKGWSECWIRDNWLGLKYFLYNQVKHLIFYRIWKCIAATKMFLLYVKTTYSLSVDSNVYGVNRVYVFFKS